MVTSMKKRWIGTNLAVIIAAASGSVFTSKPAAAYCVYNESNDSITALQLPLGPHSFKAVIQPGSKSCCNWSEASCVATPGRYGKTPFALYRGALNTDAITSDQVIKEISGPLASVLDQVLNVAKIPPLGSSAVQGIHQALDKYIPSQNALGVVQTYNGGIVEYKGGPPVGCWTGPCQGQDVNVDGSTGYKQ